MRKPFVAFDSFRRDSAIKRSFILAFVFFFLTLGGLLLTYSRLPPLVPLYYSRVRGEAQLAGKIYLFLLPAISLLTTFVHLFISKYNFTTDRLLSRLTATTAAFMAFLFFIALIHIILIVT